MAVSVALDAGHYTGTSGKRSPDGLYREYEFNWDVCLKIEAHLKRCGITVYRTRENVNSFTTTNDLDLKARTNLANAKNVNLFFSVHSNAHMSDWSTARGLSAHIYPNTTHSKADTYIKTVFPLMTEKYGLTSRGIVEQNFHVLRATKMSAMLVEHGFHTNKDDVALLKSQEFRRDIAELDAKAICKILGVTWVDGAKFTHTVYAYGTVNTELIPVKTDADINSKELSLLNKGCSVEIVGVSGDYYQIAYGEDSGYVKKLYIDTDWVGIVPEDTVETPQDTTDSIISEDNVGKTISLSELRKMGYTSITID